MKNKPYGQHLIQLPCLTLTPTTRSQAAFEPFDVMLDPDCDDQVYLTVYCMGMDVQVSLDLEQAKLLRNHITESLPEPQDDLRT